MGDRTLCVIGCQHVVTACYTLVIYNSLLAGIATVAAGVGPGPIWIAQLFWIAANTFVALASVFKGISRFVDSKDN